MSKPRLRRIPQGFGPSSGSGLQFRTPVPGSRTREMLWTKWAKMEQELKLRQVRTSLGSKKLELDLVIL